MDKGGTMSKYKASYYNCVASSLKVFFVVLYESVLLFTLLMNLCTI
jgi:hypothetical protein